MIIYHSRTITLTHLYRWPVITLIYELETAKHREFESISYSLVPRPAQQPKDSDSGPITTCVTSFVTSKNDAIIPVQGNKNKSFSFSKNILL